MGSPLKTQLVPSPELAQQLRYSVFQMEPFTITERVPLPLQRIRFSQCLTQAVSLLLGLLNQGLPHHLRLKAEVFLALAEAVQPPFLRTVLWSSPILQPQQLYLMAI